MPPKGQYHATTSYFKQLRCDLNPGGEWAGMGKADRKEMVLQFLAETRLALPPAVLYRNLRLRQNATFSEKSLGNYLSELETEGLVKRVDPDALERREIVTVGADARGYYLITDAGVEAAPDSFSFR